MKDILLNNLKTAYNNDNIRGLVVPEHPPSVVYFLNI